MENTEIQHDTDETECELVIWGTDVELAKNRMWLLPPRSGFSSSSHTKDSFEMVALASWRYYANKAEKFASTAVSSAIARTSPEPCAVSSSACVLEA